MNTCHFIRFGVWVKYGSVVCRVCMAINKRTADVRCGSIQLTGLLDVFLCGVYVCMCLWLWIYSNKYGITCVTCTFEPKHSLHATLLARHWFVHRMCRDYVFSVISGRAASIACTIVFGTYRCDILLLNDLWAANSNRICFGWLLADWVWHAIGSGNPIYIVCMPVSGTKTCAIFEWK